ncbi:hypothetical protein GWI33_004507 [Rhynchophorus ferrugineus]|uniref:Uncharacterized protein n=1 Tax=Rhynchophorus ferrugineus TaxID=354439 RepID=A0A834ILF8_RHYFE|nr:hypothetical protein GWI33_004507 [Rhynchophorus ferrugineus]
MNSFVENSPGRKALEIMDNVNKEIVFKKPLGIPRKRRKVKVLDEDTYVEQIGNIIQRDYFPDLEKIKAQNEYLDAMEKNDRVKLRELYMKYSGSKPPTERIPSPATFETPASLHNRQEDITLETPQDDNKKDETDPIKCKISLDQYLNTHTSQDNDNFEEILQANEQKHREKFKQFYKAEDSSDNNKTTMLALPSIEQQAALPERPFNVNTWGYRNKNYLMFNPDGQELTKEQELELLSNRQQITYENTRLRLNPFNDLRSKETINELAKTQAKVLDGKIGVDGKELLKPETPNIGGYSFIRSPSPSPSLLGSPLMTWGEIEGTPFRLDGSDTPISRSQGPSFKIAEPPRREQIALALAEKAGEKNRDKKKKALDAQRKQFSSPSPRPNSSSIDRLATMSPAAKKLASSHLKLSVNSDLLRTTYSASPSGFKTPVGTPKTPTPKRSMTPKINLGIKKAETKEVSTDDLLKISLPSRKKASDFF